MARQPHTDLRIRRIALLMGQDLGYNREVLKGIQSYTKTKPSWVFRDGPLESHILKALREWAPHGIIAHLFFKKLVPEVIKLGVPLVNTTSTIVDLNVPLVEVDHESVGRLAARYFLDRGFKQFGFFGSGWTGFSKGREAGFKEVLEQSGYLVNSCYAEYLPRPSAQMSWVDIDDRVRTWLLQLPKPVAILASNDVPARELSDICRQLGMHVPDQVALLGVDNDQLECNLASPPLSSIAIPGQQIGYEAARKLDLLMGRKSLNNKATFFPPVRVVSRLSTDTLAIEDSDVRSALAYIRSHAHLEIGVDAVHDEVAVSRRVLERKFRVHLSRTVLEEIRRVRLDIAKELLSETDLPMSAIARRSGFSGARRLAVVFKEVEAITPTEFRNAARQTGALSQNET